MKKIHQAPEAQSESAGARLIVHYKGTQISLSKLQCLLFLLLSNGKKYSSHKIMQIIHTSDPRKEVQYLRRKGINVQDEWIAQTAKIPRHKRYWIDPKECE
ncbi:MAG: hypothetical protein SNF97_08905 [Rikenellaceae bacterium]